jgi:two-component system, chemotaxis family, chemotaxis protein CheY
METSIGNCTVLIVDDVRATRAMLKSLLRDMQVTNILEADDGAAALRILQAKRVDIVITDLVMAPIDGLELTRKLRQPYGKNAFVPVMMISGHDEPKHITEALEAGVACFMKKPLAAGPFMARIKSLLLHPRAPVKAAEYWGPDRRKRELPVHLDRRGGEEFDLDAAPDGEQAMAAPNPAVR